MELDLDLSLSPHTNSSKLGFGFDLNKHCAAEGVVSCLNTKQTCFESMFWLENMEEDCYVPKPRSFSLNGQPDEEEEDHLESDSSIVDDEEENSEVVGWPPVKSCMTKYHNYRHHSRNHPYHHRGSRTSIANPTATTERVRPSSSASWSSSTSSRSSMYVKVKMNGVAIARKVDIKLFNSYESLTSFLINMFSQYQDCDREDTSYKFTFQGKEGDWLLPGDVPWKIFAESVHRISIIRDCPCAYTRLLF
ncbi:Auxin-responsive protein IAA29 [Raphanus sativus]|uniref:Auxin-responsive protein n=1 Tax=Raphanus sativus TaxID=3726 RepID=A0A6J0N736_RAPSA|nr:auxin-responsive protein IAA29 [Raphanus sativus]KAJ4899153.1 Auxin-responsive protein IAA29 [Raphanus sativus]